MLVEEATTRGVDDHGAIREAGDFVTADQVARLGSEPGVQAEHLGPRQQVGEGDGRGAGGLDFDWIDVRIGDEHLRPKRPQHAGHPAANRAETDKSGSLSFELRPGLTVRIEVTAPDTSDEIFVPLG